MGGPTVRFRVVPYDTPLRTPVGSSHGSATRRAGLFLVATAGGAGASGEGAIGVGEAAPLPSHGTEDLAAARTALGRLEGRDWHVPAALFGSAGTPGRAAGTASGVGGVASGVVGAASGVVGSASGVVGAASGVGGSADAILDFVDEFLDAAGPGASEPAARFACEVALLDLAGRLSGRPIADLLGGVRRAMVPVNWLLVASDPDAAAAEALRARDLGFRTIKIKVGGPGGAAGLTADATRVRAVRSAVGGGVALRLDANRAWDLATAWRAVEAFSDLGIEFLEEPLADPSRLAVLRGTGAARVPLAADESACERHAFFRLLADEAVDAVVLKPAVLGGLGAALRLARSAAAVGARVTVTSAMEREVGVAAALHLACALPRLDMACGLATLGLLDGPPCPALETASGALSLPAGPGLGIAPPPEVTVADREPTPGKAAR